MYPLAFGLCAYLFLSQAVYVAAHKHRKVLEKDTPPSTASSTEGAKHKSTYNSRHLSSLARTVRVSIELKREKERHEFERRKNLLFLEDLEKNEAEGNNKKKTTDGRDETKQQPSRVPENNYDEAGSGCRVTDFLDLLTECVVAVLYFVPIFELFYGGVVEEM